MKSFSTSIAIGAPPARVWQILTNVAQWTDWNTTVERVTGEAKPGGSVTVYAKISPGRAFPLKVQDFSPPQRMVWTGGMPLGLFKGTRTYTLVPKGDQTEFTMQEEFTGLLSPLIEKSIPDMQPSFDEFAACLKRAAESK